MAVSSTTVEMEGVCLYVMETGHRSEGNIYSVLLIRTDCARVNMILRTVAAACLSGHLLLRQHLQLQLLHLPQLQLLRPLVALMSMVPVARPLMVQAPVSMFARMTSVISI